MVCTLLSYGKEDPQRRREEMSSIRKVWGLHVLIVAGLFLVLLKMKSLGTVQKTMLESFSSMALLMNFNLFALLWSFKRIFCKKSIALSALVIVFKWLVVLYFLFLFLGKWRMDVNGILLGALTLVLPLGYFIKGSFRK